MLAHILTEQQERLLAEERRVLSDLRVALARLDVASGDDATFERSIRQLDELFLLVVVGEFNSGKSVFINALLGSPVLEEGVTPTTDRIHLLKYGEEISRQSLDGSTETVTAPVDLLQEVTIVDTPGTNAIHRQHEALTREFVPRSDLVFFVTSADRPFTESERSFLAAVREWGKKIVVVVNKTDILETEDEIDRVVGFVAESFHSLLADRPKIFPVSARQALRAKTTGDGELLKASRFEVLESFIQSTLDEQERFRLKLANPIGVGQLLTDKYLEVIDQRLDLLKDDLHTLQEIEAQLAAYEEDRSRDFDFRRADIDNVLLEFEARGVAFFEETMRLSRVVDLINKSKIKSDFGNKVVADLPQVIESRVGEIIDWMAESELRQWQAVMAHLEARRARHVDRIVGQVGGSFESSRKQLLESVGRAARRAVESYDKDGEATRLAESVQMAVAGAALLGAGAVGLGTLVTMIASTTLADVTGIVAAGTLSVVGLLVIPARRRKAKRELRRKVEEVRARLMGAITGQFEREMGRSLSRIREAISPYTRFVRAEQQRLTGSRGELAPIKEALEGLKSKVESL